MKVVFEDAGWIRAIFKFVFVKNSRRTELNLQLPSSHDKTRQRRFTKRLIASAITMRRRVVAENRAKRDEDTRIPANRRTGNGVSHSRVGSAEDEEDTASQNWPTSIKESGEKGAQRNQNFSRDREKIVFIVLAISGAALIVVACFTFNLISVTADSRIIKILPFLSDATTDQETRKEQGTTHSVATKKMPFFDKKIIDETHVSHTDSSIRFEMDDVSGYDYGSEDHIDYYYEFDDDYIRSPMRKEVLEKEGHVFEDEMEEYCCRRTSEHRLSFPNCNTFHETPMLDSQATIIGYDLLQTHMRFKYLADSFTAKFSALMLF